jgi:hypothetical protein
LTPLYIGEVAAVWAFGISWLLAGFYLTAPHRSKPDRSKHDRPKPDRSRPVPA